MQSTRDTPYDADLAEQMAGGFDFVICSRRVIKESLRRADHQSAARVVGILQEFQNLGTVAFPQTGPDREVLDGARTRSQRRDARFEKIPGAGINRSLGDEVHRRAFRGWWQRNHGGGSLLSGL